MKPLRGFKDIIEDSPLFSHIEQILKHSASQHGFCEVRLPILENIELFKRSVGEHTDIVGKEMYHFDDQNGEHIALRPEGTASCVRAMINQGIIGRETAKCWYTGPMFRRERPQKGRLRQFHQFGLECFGFTSIHADIEMIQVAKKALQSLALLSHCELHINYLPCQSTKDLYIKSLKSYFEPYKDGLSDDLKIRLEHNPLRVLDSKDPAVIGMIDHAPRLDDFYNTQEQEEIAKIKSMLTALDTTFSWNTKLVRGLDYYEGLVFEWQTDLLGSQSAVCGGGRYDQLSALLGGKSWPATGLSFGIERLVLMMQALNIIPQTVRKCTILCHEDQVQKAFEIQSFISYPGQISIDFQFSSIKKGLSRAVKQGANHVIMIQDKLTLKNLSNSDEKSASSPQELNQLLQEQL